MYRRILCQTVYRPTCVFEYGLTLLLPLIIDSSPCYFPQQFQALGVWGQCQLVNLALQGEAEQAVQHLLTHTRTRTRTRTHTHTHSYLNS